MSQRAFELLGGPCDGEFVEIGNLIGFGARHNVARLTNLSFNNFTDGAASALPPEIHVGIYERTSTDGMTLTWMGYE